MNVSTSQEYMDRRARLGFSPSRLHVAVEAIRRAPLQIVSPPAPHKPRVLPSSPPFIDFIGGRSGAFILNYVASKRGVSVGAIRGSGTDKITAAARHEAAALIRVHTRYDFCQVGRVLNHSRYVARYGYEKHIETHPGLARIDRQLKTEGNKEFEHKESRISALYMEHRSPKYIAEKLELPWQEVRNTLARRRMRNLTPKFTRADRDWLFLSPPEDLLSRQNRILFRAAKMGGVSVSDICGERRGAKVVRLRDDAIWQLRTELKLSFEAIGFIFNRHHSSIMASVRRYQMRAVRLQAQIDAGELV